MATESRTTSSSNPNATDGIVCPFCAHVRGREAGGACPKCTMEDTVGTRRSTGERIGPWFVLQRKNPTAPGLRFSVLLTLARRGHVTGKSIVRGPTTGQLWRFAAEVKGLSRLFGVCWHCRADVSPDATTCARCKSTQEIPDDPDLFLENQSTLPVMRDLPSASEVGVNRDARPPARPNRDRLPERGAAGGEGASFDDLDDLTRALTLHRAAEPPPTRRTNGRVASETILSASDLAAAFQLDAPRAGFVVRTRRALWTLTKVTIVLAIVLGLLGTAVALMKPQWRQLAQDRTRPLVARAGAWWDSAYAAVAGSSLSVEARDAIVAAEAAKRAANGPVAEAVPPPTPIRADEAISSPTNPGNAVATSRVIRSTPPSVVDATPAGADAMNVLGDSPRTTPATKPAAPKLLGTKPIEPILAKIEPQAEPPTHESPKVPTRESSTGDAPVPGSPNVAAAEAATKQPAPPEARKPAAHEMTLDEAIAQASELRNSALDAEARHDWKAAVMIYQQIATLPEAAQPSDLKVRLGLAREQLQAQ